jgi:hypothetical protein
MLTTGGGWNRHRIFAIWLKRVAFFQFSRVHPIDAPLTDDLPQWGNITYPPWQWNTSVTAAANEFWIGGGRLMPHPRMSTGALVPPEQVIRKMGGVRVNVGPMGTVMRWDMASANWSSLFFAKDWLSTLPGPYTLEFFNSGWFHETHETAKGLRDRIDSLISRADLHLSSRVFTRTFIPQPAMLPGRLRESWEVGCASEDNSVECAVDIDTGRHRVERVGISSAMANIWGVSPESQPCQIGNTYDRVVSRAYFDVLRTGRPHYDHVFAAMPDPGGEVQWRSYQRLIYPGDRGASHFRRVRIVSEECRVAIPVL